MALPSPIHTGAKVNGQWQSGFFDKGTFLETMGEWGKTVVTGRAKLGGIPLGVVAVEVSPLVSGSFVTIELIIVPQTKRNDI